MSDCLTTRSFKYWINVSSYSEVKRSQKHHAWKISCWCLHYYKNYEYFFICVSVSKISSLTVKLRNHFLPSSFQLKVGCYCMGYDCCNRYIFQFYTAWKGFQSVTQFPVCHKSLQHQWCFAFLPSRTVT